MEDGPADVVKKVWTAGGSASTAVSLGSGPFRGLSVALWTTSDDGRREVFYRHQKIREIDLHEPEPKLLVMFPDATGQKEGHSR